MVISSMAPRSFLQMKGVMMGNFLALPYFDERIDSDVQRNSYPIANKALRIIFRSAGVAGL